MVCATMKRILIVASGGIAIIKLPLLIRMLRKEGCEVRLVLTENAARFITPLTFETLLDHPVYDDMFARRSSLTHISLREWAEMVIVAPGSANLIAKIAAGIADDLASTVLLGAGGTVLPKYICPAMNDAMWASPATRRNIAALAADGWRMLGPAEGELACGAKGTGRMIEPEEIARAVLEPLPAPQRFAGKIVITAGGTQEDVDAVRFIGNRSSGRMGAAIAAAAKASFQEVVCIHAALTAALPEGVRAVEALSAREMLLAVRRELAGACVLIMAAAVADFTPDVQHTGKIKKREQDGLALHLIPTPDILRETIPERREGGVYTVGFALESDSLVQYAGEKLREKSLDAIVANPLGEADAGFGADTNRAVYLTKDGDREDWPLMTKREMADRLLSRVLSAVEGTRE